MFGMRFPCGASIPSAHLMRFRVEIRCVNAGESSASIRADGGILRQTFATAGGIQRTPAVPSEDPTASKLLRGLQSTDDKRGSLRCLSGVRTDLEHLSASRTPAIGNFATSHARIAGEHLAAFRRHACSFTLVPAASRGFPVPFPTAASPCAAQPTLRSARGGIRVDAIDARSAFRSGRGGGIMNADTFDMSTSVTRGELREELALFEGWLEDARTHDLVPGGAFGAAAITGGGARPGARPARR